MANEGKVKNKIRTVPRTYDKNGFKLRAGCLCFKDETEKEVLLVTSSRDSNLWVVPAGGIDPGESAEEAAIREVYEEAGAVGKIDKCLGVFRNDKSKSQTYVYSMIVKNLVAPVENKERKWYMLKDAHTKLNHRPIQQSYITSALTNNLIKDSKKNVYTIGNLLVKR